jgi:hypothetical protein
MKPRAVGLHVKSEVELGLAVMKKSLQYPVVDFCSPWKIIY